MGAQVDGGVLTGTITQHPSTAIVALNCNRLNLVSKALTDAFLASQPVLLMPPLSKNQPLKFDPWHLKSN